MPSFSALFLLLSVLCPKRAEWIAGKVVAYYRLTRRRFGRRFK